MTGERTVSARLLRDTAKAWQSLVAEARAAEEVIADIAGAEPGDP